jgi:hypothetical protein
MDRLLSEQEICDIPPTGFDVGAEITDEDICKAQDAKTAAAVNAEWVTWFEKLCTGDVYGGMTILHKHWIERKGSIGL